MTNGCFDLLHPGHIAYLEAARALGDWLIVAVNDDASVRRLKGASRPLNDLDHRMQVLRGLAAVDWVVSFSEDTPERVICRILPDVLVKGSPSCLAQMVKAHEKVGGNMLAVDPVPMERVSSYGVIAPKDDTRDGRLVQMTGMVEKPPVAEAPSNLKITGRYILQPEIFELLENQGKGAGGEIQLTDAMARLMEKQSFYAYEFEGKDYDCGSKIGYFEAVLAYALDNEEIGNDARTLAKAMLDKA